VVDDLQGVVDKVQGFQNFLGDEGDLCDLLSEDHPTSDKDPSRKNHRDRESEEIIPKRRKSSSFKKNILCGSVLLVYLLPLPLAICALMLHMRRRG
jgi:hypothetical protein